MTVTVRRAIPEDVPFLAGLVSSEDVAPFLASVRPTSEEELAIEVARSLAEPDEFGVMVFAVEGERAGTATWEVVNRRSRIAAVGGFAANTPATPGHVFRVVCAADCASFLWEDKSGNLPDIPVDSILVNPNLPGQVFAGSDWGLYYTDDVSVAEPVWQRFTAGLPQVMIWDMAIDRGFTTLALFTRSRGAYAWPLPTEPADTMPFLDGFETGDTSRWSSTVP